MTAENLAVQRRGLISLMGLLLSPVAHRVLHKFHLSDEDMNDKKSRKDADSRSQGKN